MPDDIDAVRAEIANITWFHRIDLGNGIITPGIDQTAVKLDGIRLPLSLAGKSVLDIGALDGAFSFEAERRGAARIVALDYQAWRNEGWVGKAGFDCAKRVLGSKIEEHVCRVEEADPKLLGSFDVVLFLGVLYHATDPLGYLAKVRSLCRGMAIIETYVDAVDYPRPACVFYPGSTLNGDPSNYFGPNPLAVKAMCREVGFSRIEAFPQYLPSRQAFHAYV
jgi:tRNA (mo5U34)-methyltransferase